MRAASWEAKGNTHLDMELDATMPYHEVMGELVCQYAPEKGRIVDLGCGLGHVEAEVFSKRPELVFDIADAYEACLEATASRGNVDLRFKLDELKFDVRSVVSGQYEVAVMSHVLEHLMFPAQALDDVFSLLKPDGILLVAVPNPVRPSVFLTNLLKRHYVNRGHVHAWDPSHWRNFLENIMGYEVLEYRSDYIQLPFATRSNLSRSIGKALVGAAPWWGFSNIAVVRRKAESNSVFDRWKHAVTAS